jgi:hypothetical protein
MTTTELAVGAAAGYFFVFGTGFVLRPELVDRFALRWTDAAGKTEVRCYYGAVSWALGGFLVYLLTQDLAVEALTGVLFLASSVLLVRIIGTAVDGGRAHPYTRMAIPVETAFVVAVAAVRFLA